MVRYVNTGVILVVFIWISVTNGQSQFSVKEEQDPGTFVGTIPEINVDYTLTDTPYFQLNNGNLLTKRRIDRESLDNDVIKLTVVSEDPGEVPIEISVTILDVNDHNPTFPVSPLNVNFTESTDSNYRRILPLADDGDSGQNAEITSYDIVSGDTSVFQVSFELNGGRPILYLNVLKPLNREVLGRYDLNISAEDGGAEPRRGYLHLIVNVQDVNDNAPEFVRKQYKESFPEDTPVGSVLFSVLANDLDLGENGRVTYSIEENDGTFGINSTTGEIILLRALDFENQKTYSTIKVVARDGGSPSMESSTLLTIDVSNVNDNDPAISFTYIPTTASIASINEKTDIGTLVALVTVSDPDESERSNDVPMGIVSGNDHGYFELIKVKNLNFAKIQVANNDSLSDQPSYNLTIRANDSDPDSERYSLASMIILVNSGENHPPKFDKKIYNVTISELTTIGSIVTSVHAQDTDIGLNGRLVYSIEEGNDLGWFKIDKGSGLMTTIKKLRFEQTLTNGSINLKISAKDETSYPLSDTADVGIIIIDENDNFPTFEETSYSFSIKENTNGFVGKVDARDNDYGKNGDFEFRLKEVKSPRNSKGLNDLISHFTIDKYSGRINVVKPLDREKVEAYILTLSVTDLGESPLTSVVDVTVEVLDVNDNQPMFYPNAYFANVNSNTKQGTVIGSVHATDKDSSDADRITYHFVEDIGSRTQYYNVNAKTGEISLAQSVVHRNEQSDVLKVFALDGDNKASTDNATFSVAIGSSLPESVFKKENYNLYMLENSPDNYVVGRVKVLPTTKQLRFYLTNGNEDGTFKIDSITGNIVVANSSLIDAESTTIYNLTITAEIIKSSSSVTVGYTTSSYLIHVIDVNDNYPIFLYTSETSKWDGMYTVSDAVTVELDDEYLSTVIYNAGAHDSDSAENGKIEYSIISSYSNIKIDSITGLISVKPPIISISTCPESQTDFKAEITACDEGSPRLCSVLHLDVKIILLDQILDKPMQNFYISLPEDTDMNYLVANYAELSSNYVGIMDTKDITYSLNPNSQFNVYPSGEVLLAQILDFEITSGYEALLTADFATSRNTWKGTSQLSVSVKDVNDNIPQAGLKKHMFVVTENASPGDFIGSVRAIDYDSGIYGSLVYNLQSSNSVSSLFYTDITTGDIYVGQSPDRNLLSNLGLQNGNILLDMAVSDQNGMNGSVSVINVAYIPVRINIEFEYRFSLYFESNRYFATKMENSPSPDVLTVLAKDGDAPWSSKTIRYQIYSAVSKETSIPFIIDEVTGSIQLKEGVSLDREQNELYHLRLKATDVDHVSNTAFANLVIQVLDEIDTPPVFKEKFFRFSISELSPVLTMIGRAEARDGDSLTISTEITYELLTEESVFDIDPATGFIFLIGTVDYEIQRRYNITVRATDNSEMSTNTYVIIDILDENDNAPKFTRVASLPLREKFYGSPTIVGTVKAEDADSDDYGRVRYSLVHKDDTDSTSRSSTSNSVVEIDPISGRITVRGMVDREETPTLNLIIRATDQAKPVSLRKFSDATLKIVVSDINDNKPEFTSPTSYVLSPQFARRNGHTIMKISATDRDEGKNGEVTIALSRTGMHSNLFTLNAENNLILKAPITSENLVYPVHLTATDKGSPPKSTRMTVYVIVADVTKTDSGPRIRSIPAITLSERSGPGFLVTSLPAASARTSMTRYYLTKSSRSDAKEDNEMFAVNRITGDVTHAHDLKGKGGLSYTLEVMAVDEESTRQYPKISRSTITIKITDENDHAPIFDSATQRLEILESLAPGTEVTKITATDGDVNNEVIYSLQTKSDQTETDFVINPKTAEISVGPNGLDKERVPLYELQVIASDGIHRSSTELIIEVDDVSDSPPKFNESTVCFDLAENNPSGTYVGRVSAKDEDLTSRVTYSLINDSYSGMFRVQQLYGIITFEGNPEILNREYEDFYILHIRAIDETGLFSDIRVFIFVSDVNDNPPIFDSSDTNEIVSLSEIANVGSYVTTVKATDNDIGLNAEIYYSIISGDPNHKFRIDSDTGKLRTISALDREEQESYTLKIIAWNKYAEGAEQQFSFKTVVVNVYDENDNPPMLMLPKEISLKENAENGNIVLKVDIIDLDTGIINKNKIALVQTTPDDGIFEIDSRSQNIIVKDVSKLDFETTTRYNLTLAAYDEGDPDLSSVTNVMIRIMNINEHSPKFVKTTYSRSLSENSPLGSFITNVHADDLDAGFEGEVQYNIVPSTNSKYFYIDRFTGNIFLANFLDYEKQDKISIEIEAVDGGANSLVSTVPVFINVLDENDCGPVVTPAYSVVHVRENTNNGAVLLKLSAIDQDAGNNGMVRFQNNVMTVPDTDAFILSHNSDGTTNLILREAIDRELYSQIEVTVTSVDSGSPPIKGSATILIIVDDENDNVPEFEQKQYYVAVPEDVLPGSKIHSVKARDDDASAIMYKLDGDSEVYPFYIDPATGEIFTRDTLDRETMNSYNITILAIDGRDFAGTQHSVSVNLLIELSDINDNSPSFTNQQKNVYVNQKNSIGTIFVAEAFDPDSGENGRIRYSMDGNSFFRIDQNTGQIEATNSLTSSHTLKIYAFDHGSPSKSTTMDVLVYLTNKSPPTITHDVNNPVRLFETTPPNRFIKNFDASSTRSDAGNLKFYLRGDRFDWFSIDQTTGNLKTIGQIDHEISSTLTMWIEVKDSGSPQLSSYVKIIIEIEDVNDNPPTFDQDSYIGHVREDQTRKILSLSATDPDNGENGKVSYSIVNDQSESPEKFKVAFSSGVLRNKVKLDREIKSSYKLVIRATDGGSIPLHRDIVVYIIVDDVNDNPPKFTRLFSASILEDAKIGDYVLQVTSTDADFISNHTYSLVDNSDGYFNIDKNGIVTLAKRLDRENAETHTLEVESTDDMWTTHTTVTVRVEDVNDNPPMFHSSKYSASVAVNTNIGAMVLKINSSDPDEGRNGKISYRISGGNRYFDINEVGEIVTLRELTCKSGFTFDCPVEHSFNVLACDSGSPNSLCSSCSVKIGVKSVNLHSPVFIENNIRIAVLQSAEVGTKVYTVTATDEDVGTKLQYEISSRNTAPYFTFGNGGDIILKQNVSNFSLGQTLPIVVKVSDDGVPPRSSNMNIVVEVTGANMHSPTFKRSSYESNPIPENSTREIRIIDIEAYDDDIGINGKVRYEIIEGNIQSAFIIGKESGIIVLDGTLDYETTPIYNIVIKATDYAVNSRSTTVNVKIPVGDVNDNAPYFNESYFEIRVIESTPTGKIISRLTAEDKDSDENALIKYYVDNFNTIGIQSSTGDIYLTQMVDFETKSTYTLNVMAENEKGNEKAESELSVVVLGSNEFPPEFLQNTYEFNIPHSVGRGTVVGFVNATDDDSGTDGFIEYILEPVDNDNFSMDKTSGLITAVDSSLYSIGDVILFTIIAKNPTSSSEVCLYDTAQLRINIISNECHLTLCENGATCVDGLTEAICYCLPGFTGELCETNIDDCVGQPCKRGTCEDQVNTYQCSCDEGYTGYNCDVIINHCENQPCENGGTCLNTPTSFKCNCPFGASGLTCNIQSINFPAQSYIIVDGFDEEIYFEFSTVSSSALLLYSSLNSESYITLEIIEKKIVMKIKTSIESDLVQVTLEKVVNDGGWHNIQINFGSSSSGTLLLDDCSSDETNLCFGTFNMIQDVDFTSSPITIGGIQGIADLNSGKLSSHDYVGCLRSLSIDSNNISSASSDLIRKKHLISNGCDKTTSTGACGANVCGNGTCTDLWLNAQCDCDDRYMGANCESRKVGQTFTGKGFAEIKFTESFVRDSILQEVTSSAGNRRRRRNVGSSSTFEIQFRTLEKESLIAVFVDVTGENYAALMVIDGKLNYHHKTESGIAVVKLTDDISGGNWHTAEVTISGFEDNSAEITLSMKDSIAQKTTFTTGIGVISNFADPLQVKTIYLGGIPSSTSLSLPTKTSFKGCVFNFKLNGITYQLNSDATNYAVTVSLSEAGISTGCDGAGLTCDLVTCTNGRICVPDGVSVSKCVCQDGYVESNGDCAMISTAGFDWWIIVVVVVLSVFIVGGISIFAVCFRRRKNKRKSALAPTENRTASYEFQDRSNNAYVTPDLLPNDAQISENELEKQNPSQEVTIVKSSSNGTIISHTNGTTEHKHVSQQNESLYKAYDPIIMSGRQSTTDFIKNENLKLTQRPASAQPNLAPVPSPLTISSDGYYATPRRKYQNQFHINQAKTLPRKSTNGSQDYISDRIQSTPLRSISRNSAKLNSEPRTYREKRRHNRKSRESETLEGMMRELSDIVGLTNEEMDLLHAGAIALGQDAIYDDGSSVSTSSLTDMSMHSRTTSSSVRVRSFVRSVSPHRDALMKDLMPGTVISDSVQSLPKSTKKKLEFRSDSYETLAVLGPFEFPPPPSESETNSSTASTTEDEVWDSTTSESTVASTVKKVNSPDNSSTSSGDKSGQLDLNFPTNLGDYFTSLVDVFDDISRLNSDDKESNLPRSEDRRPSVLPGFVGHEVSLWSDIETLSKRPLRKGAHERSTLENISQSSINKEEGDDPVTPVKKRGSRVNSPSSIILEQVNGRESRASERSLTSPTEVDPKKKKTGRNTPKSSSGRSSRNSKMKTEFEKYV
uniref:protocadherin Fat 4-like isoform X2 n=1 Tax=Styela clava TaxID=7725 RepID=UPI00193A7218|nr:protocadherin Fat 4-like isoform X2 [Styela clava]